MVTDLIPGMAGLSGTYSKVEEEDRVVNGSGRPFLPDEYETFICSFEKIARNSKKGYDGDPRFTPVTKHDLDTRLILGEEVMHWAIGEDSLGNEAWFCGEEKIMLFVRGGILEVFQPENNYAHGLLCLEQCGHDYSIKKQNREYLVSIANKWNGNHSVREKAVVNALLCMVGKECYYGGSDKREVVREVIKEVVHEPEIVEAVRLGGNGSLKSISVPFSRR